MSIDDGVSVVAITLSMVAAATWLGYGTARGLALASRDRRCWCAGK
jgi:hypothetical protein